MYIITWDSGITQPEDKGILLKDIIENGEPQLLSKQGKNIKKEYVEKSHSLMARDYKGFGNQEMTGIKITGGAFRGRNPENPSVIGKVGNQNKWKEYEGKSPTLRGLSRSNNIPKTKQKLEINQTGKSNALTSVSKDSLCIQIGKADLNGHDYVKRVYSPEGKSPNLCTGTGGNHEPKISEDNITWRKLTPRECARLQTIPEDLIEKMLNCGVSNSQLYKMLGNGWTVDVIAHIFKNINELS